MRIVSEKPYTAEYWEAHRGIPGASDAECVCSPAKAEYPTSAQTLIDKLIADHYDHGYGMHEEIATRAMRNGLASEPRAKAFLQFELGIEMQDEIGFCVTDDGRFGCTPDVFWGDDGGTELKVPDHKTHVGYMRRGMPKAYAPQVHWSLIVTGRKWWKWVSWNPYLPPVIVHIEPDEYTEKLRANMERFWKEYQAALNLVNEKIPPPPAPEVIEFTGFGSVEIPSFASPF